MRPSFAEVHNQLGLVLTRSRDANGAEQQFREAIAAAPSYAEAANNLGTLLGQQGRDHDAETSFRSAVAANPRFAQAWINLAATLASESRFLEARAAVDAALRIDPRDADALRLRQMLPDAARRSKPTPDPAPSNTIRRENRSTDLCPIPGYPSWSRRRLLQTGAMAASRRCVPSLLRAAQARSAILPPFSRFTDVAAQAGLTQPIIYGPPGRGDLTSSSRWAADARSSITTTTAGWTFSCSAVGFSRGTPPGSGNRLYHNNRDGTFSDVTAKSGLNDPGWANGVCVGDYNNDGLEDLFLNVLRPQSPLPKQRRRHFYRCHGAGGACFIPAIGSAPDALFLITTATAILIFSSPTTLTSTSPPPPGPRFR